MTEPNDIAAALGGGQGISQQGVVAETPTGVGAVQVPGPAAVSLDPSLAQPQQGQQPQQPQIQQPQVQQVAPTNPGTPEFINPHPDSAIQEPPRFDSQTGQPLQIIAPANQPPPANPQIEAQEAQRQADAQPPSVAELAEASNALRQVLSDTCGSKIAALLDRVAEARISEERQQQQQQQIQQGQPVARFDPQTGQPVQQFITH